MPRIYNPYTKTFGDVPAVELTNGEAVMAGNYAITGTGWNNTGLTVALPAAGTYKLLLDVAGNLNISAGSDTSLIAQVYDFTKAIYVPNTGITFAFSGGTGANVVSRGSVSALYVVDSSRILYLHAQRSGTGPTYTTSNVISSATNITSLTWLKMA
jgi:hypothetical protein